MRKLHDGARRSRAAGGSTPPAAGGGGRWERQTARLWKELWVLRSPNHGQENSVSKDAFGRLNQAQIMGIELIDALIVNESEDAYWSCSIRYSSRGRKMEQVRKKSMGH